MTDTLEWLEGLHDNGEVKPSCFRAEHRNQIWPHVMGVLRLVREWRRDEREQPRGTIAKEKRNYHRIMILNALDDCMAEADALKEGE